MENFNYSLQWKDIEPVVHYDDFLLDINSWGIDTTTLTDIEKYDLYMEYLVVMNNAETVYLSQKQYDQLYTISTFFWGFLFLWVIWWFLWKGFDRLFR